jgi:drug/metabolite transporter (DMT)-like permease
MQGLSTPEQSASRTRLRAVLFALGAAALFGISTPFAKFLLGGLPPVLLAGLLYLGSGIGLALLLLVRRLHGSRSVALGRSDVPWLAGAVVCGGVLGPVLLMVGLRTTPASTTALLLNLEGVFTALLAWFVFGENLDRRIAVGMAIIVGGGAVLSWQPTGGFPLSVGALAVAGACLCWAIDNNLTQKVSAADPMVVASIKGLAAGLANTALGLLLQPSVPRPGEWGLAALVGFLGYGLSLTLFVVGLRHLGTARTAAYFSLAPFIGMGASVLIMREPVTPTLAVAGILMAIGAWLHVTERHEHEHAHDALAHRHTHSHDEHHQHAHESAIDPAEPHSHWHVHAPMVHKHPHYPDIHHRHEH